MQDKPVATPYWLIAATFVGLGDTLFLSYNHLLGIVPGCSIIRGCEVVLTSKYSMVFGVPFAYLGLIFYAYMLGLGIMLAIDPRSLGLRVGALIYTAIGLLCSIGFESLQIFVIGAICQYCLLSAITTLALFSIAVWHFRLTKSPHQRRL